MTASPAFGPVAEVAGALERFITWLASYTFVDRRGRLPAGLALQYHSRSDEHSKRLGELIVDDLLDGCRPLREHAAAGRVAYGINIKFRWPNGKEKTLDLAFGIPAVPLGAPPLGSRIHRLRGGTPQQSFARVLIACEEKAVMTEHGKSQPRIYSELNDAHTIVHQGDRDAIAAGITMVNIARTFISPLRQRPDQPVRISPHRQPEVTARMVRHLRRLPQRDAMDQVGLDAYCTFVVEVDNQGHVALQTAPPAPQPGDIDHYDTFLERICRCYAARFADLAHLPEAHGISVEEALTNIARAHPGLLSRVGELAVSDRLEGADELQALLSSLDRPARGANGK